MIVDVFLGFLSFAATYAFGYYVGKRRGRYEAVREFQINAQAISRYNLGRSSEGMAALAKFGENE